MSSLTSASNSPDLQRLLSAKEPRIHLAPERPPSSKARDLHPDVQRQRYQDVWWFLVGWRLFNAIFTTTFFQPDEYFQSLEPAWKLAFGQQSGAWITWEWHHQLRSSIHPYILSLVYIVASWLGLVVGFPPTARSQLLMLAPKVFGAFVAATFDYNVWRFSERIYGGRSTASYAVLGLTVFSPWQWFASTRSLVNGLEASITAGALRYWPWSWTSQDEDPQARMMDGKKVKLCATMACLASLLRPTNLMIWAVISAFTIVSSNQSETLLMIQDASIYSTATIALSNGLDRMFYGQWTFPAARFLQFNLLQDLAVFYGRNRPDYYFTEGLPILLTCALPFAAVGIVQALGGKPKPSTTSQTTNADPTSPSTNQAPGSRPTNNSATRALSATAILYTTALSLIAHKEVRFLYPLLPILLVLAAPPLVTFFAPFPNPASLTKKLLLALLLAINLTIAVYVTHIHARGVIDVLAYLRTQLAALNAQAFVMGRAAAPSPATLFSSAASLKIYSTGLAGIASPTAFTSTMALPVKTLTAAFLMPCHSTPWRSHLVYPQIRAWALTCEPPVHIAGKAERENYTDEADVFYADPVAWLAREMEPVPSASSAGPIAAASEDTAHPGGGQDIPRAADGRRKWPRYVVFFAQLEPVVREVLGGEGSRYGECWRGFNTRWHDDWRRVGDVVVWCADGGLDYGGIMAALKEEENEEL